MRNDLTIPEAILQVGRHWRQLNGNKPVHRTYIIAEVLKLGEQSGKIWKPSSVMPSDFCYNLENQGSDPAEAEPRMFMKCNPEISDGLYEFVDLNYHYTGVVHANPKH